MKYRVTIQDWTLYWVEVEGKDEKEAEANALLLFENNEVSIGDHGVGIVNVSNLATE
jgi:hypothetical protein